MTLSEFLYDSFDLVLEIRFKVKMARRRLS